MPFKSVKQRKFMWANHPDIAKRWTKKYGSKVVKGKSGPGASSKKRKKSKKRRT